MWLLDQWAERHILEAQRKGELDNLPGSGAVLVMDDNSHVPPELRSAYRLLKNAGCLPPELEQRKEAVELLNLIHAVREDDPNYQRLAKRLALPEMKLQQAGINSDFLQGEYGARFQQKFKER
ncbi:MAG: DUF1992 domain-containing protein [Enterobacteriaceae bacterium]